MGWWVRSLDFMGVFIFILLKCSCQYNIEFTDQYTFCVFSLYMFPIPNLYRILNGITSPERSVREKQRETFILNGKFNFAQYNKVW